MQYRIVVDGIIKAEVYYKLFFIDLADYTKKEEFEKCYEADLRELKEKFKLVLNGKDYKEYEYLISI